MLQQMAQTGAGAGHLTAKQQLIINLLPDTEAMHSTEQCTKLKNYQQRHRISGWTALWECALHELLTTSARAPSYTPVTADLTLQRGRYSGHFRPHNLDDELQSFQRFFRFCYRF